VISRSSLAVRFNFVISFNTLYNHKREFSGEGGFEMCVSCGCGQPNDKHGNPSNITMDELKKAAQAANENVEDVAKNIAESVGLNCK